MNIILKEFQKNAINSLKEAFSAKGKEIILKSPTGSGKTIILTSFIHEFVRNNKGYCFVWLTPGKGNLEEQSKDKMDKYFPKEDTCLLRDVLISGFQEGQTCFINWELVTKDTNTSMMVGEEKNLRDIVGSAQAIGLKFVVIVDEEHLNKSYKASDIIRLFNPEKVIRASATPQKYGDATLIEIPDSVVIAEGLIKKYIYINDGVESGVDVDNQVDYLLTLALKKREEIRNEFIKRKKHINPLIIIQMPNKSDALIGAVENFLESKGITYDNHLLAKWLASDTDKINLKNIEEIDAEPICLIFKEAVATGWDCTRAQILVKLREGMGDTFEIQTIGRIRRMPEGHHYDNLLLDVCYLYTFDDKFKQGVKQTFGKNAPEIKTLFLKEKHKDFKLVKYFNPSVSVPLDPRVVCECIRYYYETEYKLESNKWDSNKKNLESRGYLLDDKIVIKVLQGKVSSIENSELKDKRSLETFQNVNTSTMSIDFWNQVTDIGSKASLSYEDARKIIFRLFAENVKYKKKFLKMSIRQIYAFVANNFDKLKDDFFNALTNEKYKKDIQTIMKVPVVESEFILPRNEDVGIDFTDRFRTVYDANVYEDYSSAIIGRSKPEMLFEKWCNENTNWFYKNGESNSRYFSILYKDNFGKQRHFYPDYILESKSGQLWIVETKGGENMSGGSEDIDKFSPFKFKALKEYGVKFGINVGFVRYLEKGGRLLINTTEYEKELSNPVWDLIERIIM